MTTQYANLSDSQVKALLVAASRFRRHPPQPYADWLARATARTTAVPELIEIKNRAKGLLKIADARPDRDAATLLYHAAVAAAFVHHAAAISRRPMRRQLTIYKRFAAAWRGQPIGNLFHEAAIRLTERE